MKRDLKTEKRKLGDFGEKIACNFLKEKGFTIIDQNYSKKWGEIDIVTKKEEILRFIEVKTVSTQGLIPYRGDTSVNVPHVTFPDEEFRPEDNIHPFKLQKLLRTIQTYLLEKNLDCEWQLDVVTVKIDRINNRAKIKIIENVSI